MTLKRQTNQPRFVRQLISFIYTLDIADVFNAPIHYDVTGSESQLLEDSHSQVPSVQFSRSLILLKEMALRITS
jgi:hypothetical protein